MGNINRTVSIALATYNGAQYLLDQLDSIVRQTVLPDEIVICDDASSDETLSIIERFTEKYRGSVLLITNSVNMGSAYSFHKAIMACSGDIILFADQDDIWSYNKVSNFKRYFQENEHVDFLISDAELVDSNGNIIGHTLWESRGFSRYWQDRFACRQEQALVLFSKNIVTGMTTAISKDLRDLCETKPIGVYHDAWYIYFGALMGLKGGLIREPLVEYRQHTNQQYGALRNKEKNGIYDMARKMPEVIALNLKIITPLIESLDNEKIGDEKALNYIDRKATHFTRRLQIYKDKSNKKRIYCFLRETFNSNYFRFGNVKTWLVDFCSLTLIAV